MLKYNIEYSQKTLDYINEKENNRVKNFLHLMESADFYREDNMRKKIYRALLYVVTESLENSFKIYRGKAKVKFENIQEVFKTAMEDLDLSQDDIEIVTICLLLIKFNTKWKQLYQKFNFELSTEEANKVVEFFKMLKGNKTKSWVWSQMLHHPIVKIAKKLFYSDVQYQDIFFKQCLGKNLILSETEMIKRGEEDHNDNLSFTVIEDY